MAEEGSGYTTITVPREVKEALNEERNEQPWGAFLEQLRQQYADPISLNDTSEIATAVENALSDGEIVNPEEIAELVANEIGVRPNDNGVNANDTGVSANVEQRLESIERQLESLPENAADKFGEKYR